MHANRFCLDEHGVYRPPGWERFAWVECGFGTRSSENWTQGASASLKQIHSDLVLRVDHEIGRLGEGDALVTDSSGVWLEVRTADCVPLILIDPLHEAIGVAHCGWRGAVAGIVEKTLQRMRQEFGSRAADVHAAIGPGIGGCCFEVGPEVGIQFGTWFPERKDLHACAKIDLEETLVRQLERRGVCPDRITRARLCTVCHEGQFHSFRRQKEAAGRMISAIRKKRKGEA
jgi:hypothetical protein